MANFLYLLRIRYRSAREIHETVTTLEYTIPVVMGRYTENTEPISDILKTNTDTDVGIWNAEKY